MTRISALEVIDVRFPTSAGLDGSDAMNPEPDAARRTRLLQDAEHIAQADMVWLPIRFLSQTEAVVDVHVHQAGPALSA
jgi:hypothetical protein